MTVLVGRSSEERVKDQSLFLQGFKVAFSTRFRSRLRATSSRDDEAGTHGPADRDADHHDRSYPSGRAAQFGGEEKKSGGGGGGWTAPARHPDAQIIVPQAHSSQDSVTASNERSLASDDSGVYFTDIDWMTAYHPSDVINDYLLSQTNSDIAICHDDTWRFFLKECYALATREVHDMNDLPVRAADSGYRTIFIKNGKHYPVLGTQGDVITPGERCGLCPASLSRRSVLKHDSRKT